MRHRLTTIPDPHADEKALWVQAKRGVLAILRVQPSKDLVAALLDPVTEEHEMLWEDIVDRELVTERMRQRRTRMPSTTGKDDAYRLEDIRTCVVIATAVLVSPEWLRRIWTGSHTRT